jgi:predicted short-subunit dehydrogenase-like oxidoreductase (DUF2520 family)
VRDVCIIGVGNLGGSLALSLDQAGYNIREFVVRHPRLARRLKKHFLPNVSIVSSTKVRAIESNIVFISTDDPEIENVAEQISPFVIPRQTVFHTSGSLSSLVLYKLRSNGASTGSIHPLISISDPFRGASQFDGSFWCVEGDGPAVSLGKRIIRAVGGKPFSVDTSMKPLYHAAAVTAAGHVTAVSDMAVQMMIACGLDESSARRILLPLLGSTVENLKHQRAEQALTGTFARLDVKAFERHLLACEKNLSRDIVRLYLELGGRSLDLVERRDGPSAALDSFRKAVSMAKRKFRC